MGRFLDLSVTVDSSTMSSPSTSRSRVRRARPRASSPPA